MRRAAIAVLLLAAACSSSAPPAEEPSTPTCEVRFAAPSGFAPLESFEERYEDHIGLRLGFRDGQDREFHVFAGIPGEFGEGLTWTERLPLDDGRSGAMSGDMGHEVWVVEWREGDVCDPRAVLGTGFTRAEFLAALGDAGLIERSG